MVEINIKAFVDQYPGMNLDTFARILNMQQKDVVKLDNEMRGIWTDSECMIRTALDSLRQPEYDSQLIYGATTAFLTENNTDNLKKSSNLVKEQALLELNQSELLYTPYTTIPKIGIDAHLYSDEEYTTLPWKRSPFSEEELHDDDLLPYHALFELIKKIPYLRWPLSEDVKKALVELARDGVTGQLMQQPVMAVCEKGANKFALVCDRSTLTALPSGTQVVARRDYNELKTVLELMAAEIKSWAPPGPLNHNWNNPWMIIENKKSSTSLSNSIPSIFSPVQNSNQELGASNCAASRWS